MIDWSRKHLSDLAWACKRCEEDSELSIAQRSAFAEIYPVAKRFSSFPEGGGVNNVATVVDTVCSACRNASLNLCQGRRDWMQPCLIIEQYERLELGYSQESR
jgi:hypothetical protein